MKFQWVDYAQKMINSNEVLMGISCSGRSISGQVHSHWLSLTVKKEKNTDSIIGSFGNLSMIN